MAFLAIAYIVAEIVSLAVWWGWFMVPLGLPNISIAHMLGINTLVNILIYRMSPLEWLCRNKSETYTVERRRFDILWHYRILASAWVMALLALWGTYTTLAK